MAVNINSDDPTMFGTTITNEFLLLNEGLNFSIDDIKKLMNNAVEATFLSKDEKSKLKSTVEIFWQ